MSKNTFRSGNIIKQHSVDGVCAFLSDKWTKNKETTKINDGVVMIWWKTLLHYRTVTAGKPWINTDISQHAYTYQCKSVPHRINYDSLGVTTTRIPASLSSVWRHPLVRGPHFPIPSIFHEDAVLLVISVRQRDAGNPRGSLSNGDQISVINIHHTTMFVDMHLINSAVTTSFPVLADICQCVCLFV